MLINIELQKPEHEYYRAINPATEELLTEMASAYAEDVAQAVHAAKRAFPALGQHLY